MTRVTGISAYCARGVALVAVLWMVAALSLSAAGLIAATRVELRGISTQRDILQASAIGDAAITVAASELKKHRGGISIYEERVIQYGGRQVMVRITPVTGLIDVARASDTLLRDLFVIAGGLDEMEAERLVAAVKLVAQQGKRGDESIGLSVPEDLLRVEGFSYTLYARIADLIVVGENSGKVNPHAAPPAILKVLAKGDRQRVEFFVDQRRARGTLADTTRFPAVHASVEASNRVRLEAFVPLEQNTLVRSRFLDLGSVSPGGAPWMTYRLNSRVVPSSAMEL